MGELLDFVVSQLASIQDDGLVAKIVNMPLMIALFTRSWRSFPLITVESGGEVANTPGPMANTSERDLSVIVSCVFHNSDATHYIESDTANNIYAVSDRVRLEIAKDKSPTLNTDYIYGLRPFGDAEDNTMLTNESDAPGFWTYRRLNITYRRTEVWTGERNNQSSLNAKTVFG